MKKVKTFIFIPINVKWFTITNINQKFGNMAIKMELDLTKEQIFELIYDSKYFKDDTFGLSQIIEENISNYDMIVDVIWILYKNLPEFQQRRCISELDKTI